MKKETSKPATMPVLFTADYTDIDIFVTKVQWFNALQFNARCHLLIMAFGEDKGVPFAERFQQYGLWFFIHKLEADERPVFYKLILSLTQDRPDTEGA
jgi:hypothetical protein